MRERKYVSLIKESIEDALKNADLSDSQRETLIKALEIHKLYLEGKIDLNEFLKKQTEFGFSSDITEDNEVVLWLENKTNLYGDLALKEQVGIAKKKKFIIHKKRGGWHFFSVESTSQNCLKTTSSSKVQGGQSSPLENSKKRIFFSYDSTIGELHKLIPIIKNMYAEIHNNYYTFNADKFVKIRRHSKSLAAVAPLVEESYCLVVHTTERKWVCTFKRALDHIKAALNTVNRLYKHELKKVKSITLALFGRYSKNTVKMIKQLVRFAKWYCKKLGLTTNITVWVYTDPETSIKQLMLQVAKYFKTRAYKLKKACGRIFYGTVKRKYEAFISFANAILSKFVDLSVEEMIWMSRQLD